MDGDGRGSYRVPAAATALLLLALGAGAVLRLAALERRPMHHDEANQALRCEPLITRGEYHYDPCDHHGPTLYYLAAPLLRLECGTDFSQANETCLRTVTALSGLAVLLLIWSLRGMLGDGGAIAATACAALSPGLVYYSRFFIQEMVLVAATMALLAALWRYLERPRPAWAAACGAAAGFMLATKETAVLSFAALGVGAVVAAWSRWRACWSGCRQGHVLWGGGACVAVLVLFYSSFGTYWQGLAGLIWAIPFYLQRAGGGGHDHGWWFYWEPLLRYEWPLLLLALVGAVAAWRDRSQGTAARYRRGLTVAAVALTAIYCAIPYKTPWCLMSSLALIALLAGCGVEALMHPFSGWRRLGVGLLLLGALVPLALCAQRLSFSTRGEANRWGYVETSRDLLHLVERLHGLAAVHPRGYDLIVAVVSPADCTWPLPWYLRRFTRVGYWNAPEQVPAALHPDLVIGDPELTPRVAERLAGERQTRLYGLRSEVFLSLDCPADLWQRMVERGQPRK